MATTNAQAAVGTETNFSGASVERKPATAYGVPLEPGERVLAVDTRPGANGSLIPSIIIGIILSVALIGLLILYRAFTEKSRMRYVTIITNKRMFEVTKTGKVLVEIPIAAVDKITRIVNQNGYSRGFSLSSSTLGTSVVLANPTFIVKDASGKKLSLEELVSLRTQPDKLARLAGIRHHA